MASRIPPVSKRPAPVDSFRTKALRTSKLVLGWGIFMLGLVGYSWTATSGLTFLKDFDQNFAFAKEAGLDPERMEKLKKVHEKDLRNSVTQSESGPGMEQLRKVGDEFVSPLNSVGAESGKNNPPRKKGSLPSSPNDLGGPISLFESKTPPSAAWLKLQDPSLNRLETHLRKRIRDKMDVDIFDEGDEQFRVWTKWQVLKVRRAALDKDPEAVRNILTKMIDMADEAKNNTRIFPMRLNHRSALHALNQYVSLDRSPQAVALAYQILERISVKVDRQTFVRHMYRSTSLLTPGSDGFDEIRPVNGPTLLGFFEPGESKFRSAANYYYGNFYKISKKHPETPIKDIPELKKLQSELNDAQNAMNGFNSSNVLTDCWLFNLRNLRSIMAFRALLSALGQEIPKSEMVDPSTQEPFTVEKDGNNFVIKISSNGTEFTLCSSIPTTKNPF